MLAKGWNPATIKKAYGGPKLSPAQMAQGLPEYPRMSVINQMSLPQLNKLGMMAEWENMVKGPKKQLARQLTSFVSKWGMAAMKLIAKLPK